MPKQTFLILLIAIVSIGEIPQIAICGNSKNLGNQDEEMLRIQVLQFLSAWLIDRDFEKAIDSFSIRAFSNEAIFDDNCSGFDRSVDRNLEDAIKEDIEIFLKLIDDEDFPIFTDLNTALSTDSPLSIKPSKLKTVNQVDQDGFLLVPVKASHVADLTPKSKKKSREFLKKYFKESQMYLSIVTLSDMDEGVSGIVCFFWEKDGVNWKISHALFPICM